MSRHRRAGRVGPGTLAFVCPTSGTSHRRPAAGRVRTASLLTAGALAGGAAIAAATIPWSPSAPVPQLNPAARDDRAGAADRRPSGSTPGEDTSPVHATPVAVVPAPLEPMPSAVPALARATIRWRAADHAFRAASSHGAAPTIEHGEVAFQLAPGVRRSEIEPALPALEEGDEHLVTCSVCLDYAAAAGHHVFLRWENDGPGSAPLDLRVKDGRLVLHGGDGHPSGTRTFTKDLGHATAGEWTDLAVRVRFSANHKKGSVSVRRDGQTVVADHHPRGGTLYPGQHSYLSAGLRRESATSHTAGVQLRDWHVSGVRHDESRSTEKAQHSEKVQHSEKAHHSEKAQHSEKPQHSEKAQHSDHTTTAHGSGGGHERVSGSPRDHS